MLRDVLMLDLDGPQLSQEEEEILRHPGVGGVILFSRNFVDVGQVQALVGAIRAQRSDLLLAVDQEGGRVQRFQDGMTRLPALGALGDLWKSQPTEAEEAAHLLGWLMATEILALGIDISFAPVLDLNPGVSAIIGRRAVHADPVVVISVLQAYVEGMHAAGMAATGKHFPGHGSVAEDSHVAIPVDRRSMEAVESYDLIPFVALVDQLQGIMPAHVIYERVAPDPAGFSAFWLQEILRRRLGFAGMIFSDDLSMEGATVLGSFADRARGALHAGCDMVLVCNNRAGALDVLAALEQEDMPANPWRRTAMLGRPKLTWDGMRQHSDYRQACDWANRLGSL